jgi:hypothetical protein
MESVVLKARPRVRDSQLDGSQHPMGYDPAPLDHHRNTRLLQPQAGSGRPSTSRKPSFGRVISCVAAARGLKGLRLPMAESGGSRQQARLLSGLVRTRRDSRTTGA